MLMTETHTKISLSMKNLQAAAIASLQGTPICRQTVTSILMM